jgi:heptaprenyl diphosphate synthase
MLLRTFFDSIKILKKIILWRKGIFMTKKVAYGGVFLALALVASYIETLIPINLGIPGVKIGLANGVIMVLLYLASLKQTYAISIARILLSGFLFGNLVMILYSMAGGMLSLTVMAILKKIGGFSPVGVSVAGGVSHNVGQLIVAMFVLETGKLVYYFPVLLVSGVVAGVLIGIITGGIIRRLPKGL